MKKTFICIVMMLVCAMSFLTSASALVSKSPYFFVQDSAGVLSESTKQTIISTNARLETLTGGQIVVVTVKYLEGLKSSEYAVRLMNEWGVGDKAKKNGMLLLLATEENKAWLTQGAGISGSFTDSRINELLDRYFWKDFDNGNYDAAVNAIFRQMVAWYESYYKVGGVLSVAPGGGASEALPRATAAAAEAPPAAYVVPAAQSGYSFEIFAVLIAFAFMIVMVGALSRGSGRNTGVPRRRNEPDYVSRRRRLNYGKDEGGQWSGGFMSGYMVGRMQSERPDDSGRCIDADRRRRRLLEDGDSSDGFGGHSDGFGSGFGGYSGGGGGGRDDAGDAGFFGGGSVGGFDSGSGSGGGFDGGGGFSGGGGGGRE